MLDHPGQRARRRGGLHIPDNPSLKFKFTLYKLLVLAMFYRLLFGHHLSTAHLLFLQSFLYVLPYGCM